MSGRVSSLYWIICHPRRGMPQFSRRSQNLVSSKAGLDMRLKQGEKDFARGTLHDGSRAGLFKDGWPSGRRRAPGKCVYVKSVSWVRIPPPPPVPIRAALSARPISPLDGRIPGVFGADLLTGKAGKSPKIALRWPILSEPADLGVLVRNSKT